MSAIGVRHQLDRPEEPPGPGCVGQRSGAPAHRRHALPQVAERPQRVPQPTGLLPWPLGLPARKESGRGHLLSFSRSSSLSWKAWPVPLRDVIYRFVFHRKAWMLVLRTHIDAREVLSLIEHSLSSVHMEEMLCKQTQSDAIHAFPSWIYRKRYSPVGSLLVPGHLWPQRCK